MTTTERDLRKRVDALEAGADGGERILLVASDAADADRIAERLGRIPACRRPRGPILTD